MYFTTANSRDSELNQLFILGLFLFLLLFSPYIMLSLTAKTRDSKYEFTLLGIFANISIHFNNHAISMCEEIRMYVCVY